MAKTATKFNPKPDVKAVPEAPAQQPETQTLATTVHPVQALYDLRAREARDLPAEEADYHALEQGEYGTNLRHAAVIKHTRGLSGRVLDLGCGTGLLLDKMSRANIKPAQYFGVDSSEDRREPLTTRFEKLGIDGRFLGKPWDMRFEDMELPSMDCALLVGVMGFWGYHTQRHVKSIHGYMHQKASHGCITFPMIWDSQQMGDLYLRRWEPTDVLDLLGLKSSSCITLEREFLIVW